MPATLRDLEYSGLNEETIASSGIKDGLDATVGALLRDRHHVDGFVIPYFGLDNKELKFYRVKVLASLNGAKPPKYIQPKAAGNHLYIPRNLHRLAPKWQSDVTIPLFITEGEKKALAGVQAGLATLAVGGVFSWRTHIHSLERGVVRVEDKASSRVIHLDDRGEKAYRTEVAPELGDIAWAGRDTYLIFDSDAETNEEVQRAAFEFANWLADRGAVARQISLAERVSASVLHRAGRDPKAKLGLDDILGLDSTFGDNLKDPEWRSSESFRPLPSDPLEWVTSQLNEGRTNRATQERVASFAIAWLDANGARFMGADSTYYYFDNETRVLHDFHPGSNLATLRETSFGHLLVEQLGLDPTDNSTVGRLIGRFPLGAPVISPHRVLAQHKDDQDTLYYQLSDADVMRISPEGLDLISNGDDDILFHRGSVDPLDLDALVEACERWKEHRKPLWHTALSTLNLDPLGKLSKEETLRLLTCMCYLSPWLNRWRGLMLPLEIAVAEPNSGKSFFYNLRMGVLTGRPGLAGLPDDFRSWVASVSNAPGFWVCDNLGNVKSEYWHRLNDELARLITDPAPSIELRQLYTTANTFRIPVHSTFAITTIHNPFSAPDILQRSLVFGLNAIPVGKRDPDWYSQRLGKRTEWVAEHLSVLQLFLTEASQTWEHNFKSGYRLVHFEQSVLVMGRVLGWDMTKIVEGLAGVVAATVAAYDPMIEAFVTFVKEWERPRRKVRFREVCDWVEMDDRNRFTALRHFKNEVQLAKYIMAHKYDLEQSTGVMVLKDGNDQALILPERTA